ncbi:ATPase [Seiridium cupressi]
MGKIFSKPVSSVAPAQQASGNHSTPAMLTEPSIQGDAPFEATLDRQVADQHRNRMLDNIEPRRPASGHHLEVMPRNSPFDEHAQDAKTWARSGDSPSQGGYNSRFSLNSTPCEFHPDTRRKVFRSSWFGEKRAVQVVCEDLCQILQRAATALPWGEENEKLFSPSSWITEPFEVIVHNRSEIVKHHSELKNGDAKKHLGWFLERLGAHQPGSTVFSIDDGAWRAYIIERSETVISENAAVLQIHACYLDFDWTGRRLLPHRTMVEVTSYTSERKMSALKLKPEWYIEQTTPLIVANLIQRGNEYFGLRGEPHYREYEGDAWPKTSHDSKARVIVDYSTSSKYIATGDTPSNRDGMSSCSVCIGESLGMFSYSGHADEDTYICVNGVSHSSHLSEASHELHTGEKALLFCPPRLWAFSLKYKTWRSVSHDDLSVVESQNTSFEQDLCMKLSRKQSLKQIVSGYIKDTEDVKLIGSKETFGRKGRGLNILLSGSSGTGKTWAAECLSEKFDVPLYSMTCGDLGVNPGVLDQKLQETFTRAKNWNSMVLLDDADIYVYERDVYNLERNALLPIFLRHLEYSDCLTFISVSRIGTVDPAVVTRIHVGVPFPNFDFGTQQKIWHRVIERLPHDYVERDEMQDFITHQLGELDSGRYREMNGRQIRNCIDVALILARNEGSSKMQHRHVERVLELGKDFKDHVLHVATESTEFKARNLFID